MQQGHSVIQILVVEDFGPFRMFVKSLLEAMPGFKVICEVTDGLQAVKRAKELLPELTLLDISLPGLNGLEVARQILKFSPESKIVFLTQQTSGEVVHEALSAGGSGYVVKSLAASELLKAMESALRGKRFLSRGLDGSGSFISNGPDADH